MFGKPDLIAIIAAIEASGLRRSVIARSLKVSRSCVSRSASGAGRIPGSSLG